MPMVWTESAPAYGALIAASVMVLMAVSELAINSDLTVKSAINGSCRTAAAAACPSWRYARERLATSSAKLSRNCVLLPSNCVVLRSSVAWLTKV
jgi:hypothetical protein